MSMEQIRADLAEIKADIKHGLAFQQARLEDLAEDVRGNRNAITDLQNRVRDVEVKDHRREGAWGLVVAFKGLAIAIVGAIAGWLAKHFG